MKKIIFLMIISIIFSVSVIILNASRFQSSRNSDKTKEKIDLVLNQMNGVISHDDMWELICLLNSYPKPLGVDERLYQARDEFIGFFFLVDDTGNVAKLLSAVSGNKITKIKGCIISESVLKLWMFILVLDIIIMSYTSSEKTWTFKITLWILSACILFLPIILMICTIIADTI